MFRSSRGGTKLHTCLAVRLRRPRGSTSAEPRAFAIPKSRTNEAGRVRGEARRPNSAQVATCSAAILVLRWRKKRNASPSRQFGHRSDEPTSPFSKDPPRRNGCAHFAPSALRITVLTNHRDSLKASGIDVCRSVHACMERSQFRCQAVAMSRTVEVTAGSEGCAAIPPCFTLT